MNKKQNNTSEPPIWLKYKSSKRNAVYYFNTKTHASVWEEPQGVQIQDWTTKCPIKDTSNACSMPEDEIDEEYVKKLKAPERNLNLKEILTKYDKEIMEKSKTKHPVEETLVLKNDLKCDNDLKKLQKSDLSFQNYPNDEFDDTFLKKVNRPGPNFNSMKEKFKEINGEIMTKEQHIQTTKQTCVSDKFNKCEYNFKSSEDSDKFPQQFFDDSCKGQLSEIDNPHLEKENVIESTKIVIGPCTSDITKTHSNSGWPENNDYKESIDMEVLQKRVNTDNSHKRPFSRVYKTPIQDRFNKQKEDLLRKQKIKNDKILNQIGKNDLSTGALKRKTSPERVFTKRPKLEFEESPTPDCHTPLVKDTVFDLRTKLLQKRKSPLFHPPSSKASESEMEWEDAIHSQQSQTKVSCDNNRIMISNGDQEKQSLPCSTEAVKLPDYKKIYLVCDTSALLDDGDFVETLISKKKYIGLPVTIVIPFIVFSELDNVKLNEKVGYAARKISRAINFSRQQNDNLHLQDGSRSREPVGSLELRVNDDLILNCCLQTREICKEGELAILMTSDNNLANKASSFKLDTHKWVTFKKWARGYQEQKRIQLRNNNKTNFIQTHYPRLSNIDYQVGDNENMDVDASSSFEVMEKSPTMSEAFITNSPLVAQQQNCIHSHLDELKLEFRMFLHNVLDEALSEQYESLKSFGNNIKPSWTLLDYVSEFNKRWFMITSSDLSVNVQKVLTQLVTVLKKSNSRKEEMIVADVENIFSLCSKLANMFVKKYQKHTTQFLEKLNNLQEDWKEAFFSISSTNNSQNICEDDVLLQPVHLALQNIYTCLTSDYQDCKEEVESTKDDIELDKRLSLFYKNLKDLLSALKCVFQENSCVLTCSTKSVIHLNKLLTCFSNGSGTMFGFEISLENVVEFFQDSSFRTNVKQHLDNFEKLDIQVENLIIAMEGCPLEK